LPFFKVDKAESIGLTNKDSCMLNGYQPRVKGLFLAALLSLLVGSSSAQQSNQSSGSRLEFPPALQQIVGQNYDWVDSSRDRDVPVRLYMPDAVTTSSNAVPLVVFSHGLGGSRNGYQYLGRFWASQGYASLHVQHIGSDNNLWRGNPLSLTMRLTSAAQDSEAMARAKDVSFALTELLAMPSLAGRIDANRIVAAGHSYGANTTMLVAGALVPGKGENGQVLSLRDPRIKAAIIMSAPPFYGFINPSAILGNIAMPTLHITATGDDILVPGYGSGFEDRVNVFNAIGDARKTLVVFAGGSHSIFTDRSNTGGAELNPIVKAATQALSLAFLKQTFAGETTALADWRTKFADLLARYIPAK
jgi:dienelactone hydrolase